MGGGGGGVEGTNVITGHIKVTSVITFGHKCNNIWSQM